MIKGINPARFITFIKVYVPNRGVTRCLKQILVDLKGEIETNTIIEDFNTKLHKCIDHPERKISMETLDLNDILNLK